MDELKEWIKSILIAVLLALIIRAFIMESFIVDGSSMRPTLENNERVLVNKFVYRFRDPKRGEVIVFPFTDSEERILIKRAIGLPGDKVEIVQGQLLINDSPLEENYIILNSEENYGPVLVPDGTLFVLGDNRSNSIDSRNQNIGFVEIESIRGKTFFRYWPLTQLRYF